MIQTVEVHLDLILGTMQGVCGFALSVDGRIPVPQSGLWQWQHHHGVSVPWPGHVEELVDVVLLIKISSLQKKKCRAAVVVVVAGGGGRGGI